MTDAWRWNGDEWRWRVDWHPRPTTHTIQVIEQPASGDEASPGPRRRVAFGFGAREPEVVEPLLWEGDDA